MVSVYPHSVNESLNVFIEIDEKPSADSFYRSFVVIIAVTFTLVAVAFLSMVRMLKL